MKYWQGHTWRDVGAPIVVAHPHAEVYAPSVTLNEFGYALESGHGYTLHFEPKHIPVLLKLVRELRSIESGKVEEVEVGADV